MTQILPAGGSPPKPSSGAAATPPAPTPKLGTTLPDSAAGVVSVITMGDHFTVQASSATLKNSISASYWCPEMDLICDGKMMGVAVRYTGDEVILMQFKHDRYSRSGRRYPFSISIPKKYLVPVPDDILKKAEMFGGEAASPLMGSSASPASLQRQLSQSVPSLHMCVVCGAMNQPGELRRHGWKCNMCIGTASMPRLRDESARINEATNILAQSLGASAYQQHASFNS